MDVYGHHSFCLHLPDFLRRLRDRVARLAASPDHDALIDLFVDVGEVHAAIADASAGPGDAVAEWSAAMQGVAAALCDSWHGRPAHIDITTLPAGGPRDIRAKTAEGFAHYGLRPEQYMLAAERFVAQRQPVSMLCVGVRSIGSPLAYAVAAAAASLGVRTQVTTVRPLGEPFDRRLGRNAELRPALQTAVPTYVAVVDEGPGLSGTSFASVTEALVDAGVAADRIVLFPSWNAPAEVLRSQRGRVAWRRHEHAVAAFEEVWPVRDSLDVSAGMWRTLTFGADETRWPAVQPQHERRKYLLSEQKAERTERIAMRFAGLGRYGRAKFERAELLAGAGFTPPTHAFHDGFIRESWIQGRRLTRVDGSRGELLRRIAAYAAFLRKQCRTGARARTEDLAAALVDRIPSDFDEPEIAVDGRMLPHEWIDSTIGLVKADALDHHADDFLPGCRDIAWDIAGAAVEFEFDAAAEAALVDEYRRQSADRTIEQRLPFYKQAYLAYRIAYAQLAAESLADSADARRFTAAASRYRRLLAALESSPRRSPRC